MLEIALHAATIHESVPDRNPSKKKNPACTGLSATAAAVAT
jgi:hypothetical protein